MKVQLKDRRRGFAGFTPSEIARPRPRRGALTYRTGRQARARFPTGFTVVEVVVGTIVISIMVIAITNTFLAIGAIQRRSANFALATHLAEQKIESLRNAHYNTLTLSPPPINFTSELPNQLAGPRSATVTVTEPTPGIKRLEVAITYQEGSQPKSIQLSAIIGNIGIAQ